MLAIGRALMARPKLLLLDEPSMGLAPILVEQIFDIVKDINASGTTVLLVEQNALMALGIAKRGYILQTGEIVLQDVAERLIDQPRGPEGLPGRLGQRGGLRGTPPMTTDAHPIATDRRLAPDPVALPRAVDEQPSAAWVATATQPFALLCQRQGGGQQVIDDRIPAGGRRPDRAVGAEAVVDPGEGRIHARTPSALLVVRVVCQSTDGRSQCAQALELARRRRLTQIGDGVGSQELDRACRGVEMVMWRFTVSCPAAVVGSRPVEAVCQAQRGVGPERPCNGVHRP